MLNHNPCVGIFWDELEKVVRFDRRMSLREFCDKAKISPGTLQNLRERESPDDIHPSTVRRIAAAIDWTIDQFNDWWKSISAAHSNPDVELSVGDESIRFRVAPDEYKRLQKLAESEGVDLFEIVIREIQAKMKISRQSDKQTEVTPPRRKIAAKRKPKS